MTGVQTCALPISLQEARKVARENPSISDEEFDKDLLRRVSDYMERYDRGIGEREAAKLKAKRDRKPDQKIAIRNVEICDLRRQDPRLWSQGRLAKKFKVGVRYIRKVLVEETEWRAKATRGPTS